jgi:hypothetical protein
MATDIVGSLFGISPEMYQQQMNRQALQDAVAMQRLSPLERAGALTQAGAYMAGQGVGGAFGIEDPMLKMVSTRNALARQFDINSPEGLTQFAQALQQSGDIQGAAQAAGLARQIQGAMVEQAQKAASAQSSMATAQKNLFDIGPSGRAQELAKTGKFTPESIAASVTAGDVSLLVPIDKLAKPQTDFVGKAVELGFGDKPNYGSYTPEQVKKINEALLKDEIDKRAAGASVTRLTVNQNQEQEFAKKRGTTQAQALDDAANLARGASQALSTLSNMKQLNASGELFTGPLANSYITGTNFLASVGLLSPSQTRVLTSSEVYDKQAKDLVMQDLGGKLGAQISDADRKFVEARIPQITTSANARTELLNKLDEIQRNKIDYYRKMNSHANKFGNLNDFDFSEQYSPIQAPSAALGTRENPIKLK